MYNTAGRVFVYMCEYFVAAELHLDLDVVVVAIE